MKEAMRGRPAVPPVRLAQVEGGELHEVLQERVLLLGYAVELIQVQQTHLGELSPHLCLDARGPRCRCSRPATEVVARRGRRWTFRVLVRRWMSRGAVARCAACRRIRPIVRPVRHPPVESLYPQGTTSETRAAKSCRRSRPPMP